MTPRGDGPTSTPAPSSVDVATDAVLAVTSTDRVSMGIGSADVPTDVASRGALWGIVESPSVRVRRALKLTDVHVLEVDGVLVGARSPRSIALRAEFVGNYAAVEDDVGSDNASSENGTTIVTGDAEGGVGDRYCEICEGWTNGPIQYEDHKTGKKHKKNMKKTMPDLAAHNDRQTQSNEPNFQQDPPLAYVPPDLAAHNDRQTQSNEPNFQQDPPLAYVQWQHGPMPSYAAPLCFEAVSFPQHGVSYMPGQRCEGMIAPMWPYWEPTCWWQPEP
jgi:hypothetical protein